MEAASQINNLLIRVQRYNAVIMLISTIRLTSSYTVAEVMF